MSIKPINDCDVYAHDFAPETIKFYQEAEEEEQSFFNFGKQVDADIQLWVRAKRSARTVETYYRQIKRSIIRAARSLVNERADRTDCLIIEEMQVGNHDYIEFCKKVRNLDWYASFSDDGKVYRRFEERHRELTEFAKTKGEVYVDFLKGYGKLIGERINRSGKPIRNNDPTVIVSAAMRTNDGVIIVSVRHWDLITHKQFRNLKPELQVQLWEQGFVDNRGNFHTREEALVIAEEAGQRFWDTVRHEQLFSENLY